MDLLLVILIRDNPEHMEETFRGFIFRELFAQGSSENLKEPERVQIKQ